MPNQFDSVKTALCTNTPVVLYLDACDSIGNDDFDVLFATTRYARAVPSLVSRPSHRDVAFSSTSVYSGNSACELACSRISGWVSMNYGVNCGDDDSLETRNVSACSAYARVTEYVNDDDGTCKCTWFGTNSDI